MNIQDLYNIKEQKNNLENELKKITTQYNEEFSNYIKNYFNNKVPKELPLSKNQFIQIVGKSFSLEKGESGKIYWKADGNLITVKDGKVTYGHSTKTLFQGEYEVMSQDLKRNTVENAVKLTKSIFPIIPKSFNGSTYANYGFELAKNTELGLLLVWRKGGTAYIDRGTGSLTSEASLQLININVGYQNRKKLETYIENCINCPSVKDELKEVLKKLMKLQGSMDISIGGRLNKEVILKNEKIINLLFGSEVVNDILTKLNEHVKIKKMKVLITPEELEKQNLDNDKTKKSDEFIVINGNKIQI